MNLGIKNEAKFFLWSYITIFLQQSLQVLFVEEAGSAKGCVYKLFYHDNSTHQGR